MGNPGSKARDGDYRMKYRSWRLGNKEGTRDKEGTRERDHSASGGSMTPPVVFMSKDGTISTGEASKSTLTRPSSFAIPSQHSQEAGNVDSMDFSELAAPVDPPKQIATSAIPSTKDEMKTTAPVRIPGPTRHQVISDALRSTARSPGVPASIEEKVMAKIPKALSTGNLSHQATFPKFQPQPQRSKNNLQEALIEQLCDSVTVTMVGAQYANTASGQILNHLYKPVYDSVRKHIKRMPRKYALTATPVEVAADLPLLAEVTRTPECVAVAVTTSSGDADPEAIAVEDEIVIHIAARDRKSLLDAITRSISARANIVSADIVTTNDGFVLDRFLCKKDATEMAVNPVDIRNEIEYYLTETVSNSPNPTMYAAKMRELEGDQVEVAAKATLPAVSLPMLASTNDTNPSTQQSDAASRAEPNDAKATSSSTSWEIDYNEIQILSVIGQGRSGKMYHAKYRGNDVAAKALDLSRATAADKDMLMGEFYREVTIVSKLKHENICGFIGVAIHEPNFVTVFELLRGGSISQLIRRQSRYSFFKLAREIAHGMCYLHANHVIHRDLKSENILLDDHGTVKIIDFGLSCFAGTGTEMTAETGTYRWMSPEVIRHEPYSFSADVYSYGIVLWELLARQQPYAGMTPVQAAFAVAKQNMRPRLPSYVPKAVVALIKQCWNQNPRVRPTFQNVSESLDSILSNLSKSDREMLDFSADSK